ncbi:unnamed protein product (macronuclear) [Paramecium tetraurelia]|uniref:Transmembrane protein n=1 Tax=Paramecium tetraurelia TaxID=5888 RepID=A0CMF2_PARTE|nr:uncharacterized protein GSPATT00008448001 [Paramecium tetraurelia]CAK71969.1 unnamed protein product [Paramecium tetraurelia]|eukprot:XP_001439366.1 hypothetical protein (macronuclear) [Paramecium tetraurelia strain d4-2]
MNKIVLQTKAFYIQDFLNVKETWRKSYLIAIVLLLIENIQLVSIYTSDIIQFEYDQFLIHIRGVIDFCRFYTIFGNSNLIKSIFVIFGFVLQSIFLILILYPLLNIRIFIQKKQQLKFLTLEQVLQQLSYQSGESNNSSRHLLNWICCTPHFCFVVLVYQQIFLNLVLICNYSESLNSLESVGLIFSILLITQQILIGLFIHLHQFEYRMKSYDFLGKFQDQKMNFLQGFQLLYIFQIDRILEQYYYLEYSYNHQQFKYLESFVKQQGQYIVTINKFLQIIEYLDSISKLLSSV